MFKKSFFLKRSFGIKLRQQYQFCELSVGVEGEIHLETGMILNLSVLDQWFQQFHLLADAKQFENIFDFSRQAKSFFEKKNQFSVLQIDWQQGIALPYSMRSQKNDWILSVMSNLSSGEKSKISFLIPSENEFNAIIQEYQKIQNEFSSSKDFESHFRNQTSVKIIQSETEDPILRRAFLESLD